MPKLAPSSAGYASGHIALTALTAICSDQDRRRRLDRDTLTATGLATTSGSGTSTSLLDNIIAAGGSAGATFALTTNAGTTHTFTERGGANTAIPG